MSKKQGKPAKGKKIEGKEGEVGTTLEEKVAIYHTIVSQITNLGLYVLKNKEGKPVDSPFDLIRSACDYLEMQCIGSIPVHNSIFGFGKLGKSSPTSLN